MTNVSKTLGFQTPTVTSGGAGFEKFGFGTKVGSGTDYPAVNPYTRKEPLPGIEVTRVRMRKGQTYVVKKIIHRFRKRRIVPQRARVEEHPYSVDIWTSDDRVFTYSAPNGAGPVNTGLGQQGWGMMTGIVDPWTANHDIALLGRLREQVAGSSFNAGTFLAEGHQALAMLANSATRIYRAVHALRRGSVAQAAEELTGLRNDKGRKLKRRKGSSDTVTETDQLLASRWLELQYGWLPLLSDAHDGAQFLAQQLEFPLKHVVRTSLKVQGPPFQASGDPYNTHGWFTNVNLHRKNIKAILTEKDVAKLSGLTDPLSVVWELLPYSFVIDWFIPIGNYLSARGLKSSLTGTFVTSDKWHIECRGLIGGGLNNRTFSTNLSEIGWKRVRFNRSVSSSLSVPSPEIKSLGEMKSWRHAANAVALLTQLKR